MPQKETTGMNPAAINFVVVAVSCVRDRNKFLKLHAAKSELRGCPSPCVCLSCLAESAVRAPTRRDALKLLEFAVEECPDLAPWAERYRRLSGL